MEYINNGSEPLQHKVYQRATPKKSQTNNNYKPRSVDTQTQQRVRPPTQRSVHKRGIFSLKPPKRMKFNFL